MRVVLVDPSLYTPPYDGALAAALAARGHEVTLAGRRVRASDPPLGGEVRLVPAFYRRGERLRRDGAGGTLAVQVVKGLEHVGGLRRLAGLVQRERADVVHWQWPSLPAVDAIAVGWLRAAAPQIVTVHDSRVFKTKHGVRRAMSLGWRRFLAAADRIVVHAAATHDSLVRLGLPASRIRLVPHPVFARPAHVVSEPLDGRFVHVAFFGRLSDDKGIDVLADALSRLAPATRASLRVHVRGQPVREDRRARAALAALGALPFVRLRPQFVAERELDALLEAVDVVVLPHREVDASGMLMKALAYDVALVVADVPTFRETLGESSAAAWFPRGDADSLAAALDALVADPARRAAMRAAASTLRAQALSWGRAAELTEAVYRDALGHRGATVAMSGA